MNERTERMLPILEDEWDCVVLLCCRHINGRTETFRSYHGNALANQKMLENETEVMVFGFEEEDDDEAQEEAEG